MNYYIPIQPGKRGGGGEYEAQDGFGWTNGVFLYFLQEYGDRISSDDNVHGTAASFEKNENLLKYTLILLVNLTLAKFFYL